MTYVNEPSNLPVSVENPFEVTKAVDFTNSEIESTWVDWPAPGGFAKWMNIASPMARIVRGGKGTGRTHLMRRFSAPVQMIHGNEPIEQVVEDGVLGIYVLCSGLNASRFQGRGLSDDIWQSLFCQFADLWLAQAALDAFLSVTAEIPPRIDIQLSIIKEVQRLLHPIEGTIGTSLQDLREYLFTLQREVDLAVNNAALKPDAAPSVSIKSTPGTLVFGIPDVVRHFYEPFRDIRFLYLVDEFENFGTSQQQYVNSLIREKKPGTSFMIGVRTYGLRTLKTLGAGEENKEGSEFEEIRPDRNYIGLNRDSYQQFCLRVVARRLSAHGLLDDVPVDGLRDIIGRFFELPSKDYEEDLVIQRFGAGERPYLRRLKSVLSDVPLAPGGIRYKEEQIEYIVDAARVPSRPLLEKANVFIIYRAWYEGKDLLMTAADIKENRLPPEANDSVQPNDGQKLVLDHYVTDLKAQLLNDMRRPQLYAGIQQFISMSDGLPRNLLITLKNIYRWALFSGESPFRKGKISLESQRKGVLESTDWFLEDARPLGDDGIHVYEAINRLGDMFRRFRFSDKPVESSLASFSADLTTCSPRAREVIKLAEQWALLIPVEQGEKHRNTGVTISKYHLNRLLSPRWNLPTARRGAILLNSEEVNAIFDPTNSEQFGYFLNRRLERMNAPFRRSSGHSELQTTFDLDTL